MSSQNFPTELGGDGSTVSDDTNPDTGLRAGGYRSRFVAALIQFVAMLRFMVSQVQIAAAYAASALNAPGTQSTSSTSLLIAGSGNKSFTTQTGKLWSIGQNMVACSAANRANQMTGFVDSYNSSTGALVLTITSSLGSGTYADWVLSLAGAAGGIAATLTLTAAGLVTGGGNLSANRTFTVTAASDAEIAAGTITNKVMTPGAQQDSMKPQTLTYAATVNWNWALKKRAKLTLTGNAILAAPTGMVEGDIQVLDVTQGGAGGWLLDLTSAGCFRFGDAGTPTLSTATGKRDKVTFTCIDPAAPVFDVQFARGF